MARTMKNSTDHPLAQGRDTTLANHNKRTALEEVKNSVGAVETAKDTMQIRKS